MSDHYDTGTMILVVLALMALGQSLHGLAATMRPRGTRGSPVACYVVPEPMAEALP